MEKYRLFALPGVRPGKDARLAAATIIAALLLGGSAANAAVMDFDGSEGVASVGYWEENNFLFNPAKSNNDTKCYDNKCLMEVGQGELTTMTYDDDGTPKPVDLSGFTGTGPGGKLTEEERNAKLAEVYDDVFNLDFFYFSLVGKGVGVGNSFTVEGTYSNTLLGTVSATFVLGDPLGAVATTGATSSFALARAGGCDAATTTIEFNCGYWVDLDDDWNSLTSVTWTPNPLPTVQNGNSSTKYSQMRLDCVGANESGLGADSSCDPSDIPLPATAWLLLGGLVGLGAVVRRRKV